MKTTSSLIEFIGIVTIWSLCVAGQEGETGAIDYVPPVPLKEVQPHMTMADGAGCCSVVSEASKTQGAAEKELAKTLRNLIQTRDSANAARSKKAMAKLVTQQKAERLVSTAVQAKAKKDAAVAESEVQALQKELAAIRAADRKSEQGVAQLDEQLLKVKEAAVQKVQSLRENMETELDLVKREVNEIQSALPRIRTLYAEEEREVHPDSVDMNPVSLTAAAKEVETPSQTEAAKRHAEVATAQLQKAEEGAEATEKISFVSVRKSKSWKQAGKLTPGA